MVHYSKGIRPKTFVQWMDFLGFYHNEWLVSSIFWGKEKERIINDALKKEPVSKVRGSLFYFLMI